MCVFGSLYNNKEEFVLKLTAIERKMKKRKEKKTVESVYRTAEKAE